MTSLTIVMYHYVREIEGSRYPRIKGLEFAGFRRQLDFLTDRFNIIRPVDLIAHAKSGAPLPERPCLLTFDDGYKDHIDYVFPELRRRSLSGAFFPPVKPVVEREMLDVNSIHFILASQPDGARLVEELKQHCLAAEIDEEEWQALWDRYAVASRFDTKEVIFFKRMLQHALPVPVRARIVDLLFRKYVSAHPAEFAESLYASIDDVRTLLDGGMFVGSHGNSHVWLNRESRESQANEIDRSLAFLAGVGAPTADWIMCYPFGGYDQDTLEILLERNCLIGLTTKVGAAELGKSPWLELPRLDTNDFPQ